MEKEIFVKKVVILLVKVFALTLILAIASSILGVSAPMTIWLSGAVSTGVYRYEFVENILDPCFESMFGKGAVPPDSAEKRAYITLMWGLASITTLFIV